MPSPTHATGPFCRDLSRRSLLQFGGASCAGLLLAERLQAQPTAGSDGLAPLNRFPRTVQEFFVAQVRKAQAERLERLEALATREDAEEYVRDVRARIAESFGPLPERTALNPQVTGVVERDAYRIENLIFESRPGFPVTANLYLPKDREFPLPGVVGSCGHSTNGKAAGAYQAFSQGLARLGYVVLIFDPLGQGERLQYPDEDLRSRIGVGVLEHLYAGNQQFLVGEFLGTWRAWDGIRALDYLETREEVDPQQIMVTGNSGGGTMTTWLAGVEQRWAAAAPSCFVTTFRHNLENELPADTEQCPPKALALGLDHEDFLAALAPKPVIILAKEQDYFDVRGSEEAYGRLKRLYGLLGAEENVGLFVGPGGHGFSQDNREAMYRWFNRATQVSDAETEPELTFEDDATLYATPRGQVVDLGARSVFSFTREKAESLRAARKPVEGEALRQRLTEALRLPPRDDPWRFRILRPIGGREYPRPQFTTYVVETEPMAQAVVYMLTRERHLSRPPGARRALLYVPHLSADAELRDEPLLAELIDTETEAAIFTCDPRGSGESQPDTCGRNMFHHPYGSDYFYAIHSLMLDRPYVGQKTFDVLRVIDFLAKTGHEEVHLVGKGRGALPAAFAAVLDDRVVQVTLKNALVSYGAVAESEDYDWPLSTFLPGVLKQFDLPDCYRALSGKGLKIIEPWDARQQLAAT